jgi:cell fate regulator YaaT (PSP1 superfamily)
MDLFIRGFSESFKIGDFVKVEADRGFDLGVIALILLPGAADYPYHSIPRRRVLSLANDEEKAFLLAKIEEEYRALDICRELATRRQMKINVLDAELQFDRRKLTFLFTSEKFALPPLPPPPPSLHLSVS